MKSLSEMIATVDTPEGRQRVFDYLKTLPFPHFEAIPGARMFVRIESDGTRAVGRFVGRRWIVCLGHERAER